MDDFSVLEALARLVAVVPYRDHDRKEVWTAYLPHAVHVVGLVGDQEAESRMLLLDRIGCCEWTLGRYQAAELAHRKVLEQRKKGLGAEHPSTLVSMNNLALALSGQGKHAEAETMH